MPRVKTSAFLKGQDILGQSLKGLGEILVQVSFHRGLAEARAGQFRFHLDGVDGHLFLPLDSNLSGKPESVSNFGAQSPGMNHDRKVLDANRNDCIHTARDRRRTILGRAPRRNIGHDEVVLSEDALKEGGYGSGNRFFPEHNILPVSVQVLPFSDPTSPVLFLILQVAASGIFERYNADNRSRIRKVCRNQGQVQTHVVDRGRGAGNREGQEYSCEPEAAGERGP